MSAVATAVPVYATREPASAFQFCPVTINAVQALHYAPEEPYRKAVDARFGIELQSDAPLVASGHISIAAAGHVYRMPFAELRFTSDNAKLAPLGFAAAPVVAAFDRPLDAAYAWVSDVESQGATVACPFHPLKLTHEFFNDRTLSSFERARRVATDARIALGARHVPGTRPALVGRVRRDCLTPDQAPMLVRGVPPAGVDLSALRGPTAVSALVYLSPAGLPLDVELVDASPVPALNRAVVAAAQNSLYAPARVDCVPSAGVYLFRALFQT